MFEVWVGRFFGSRGRHGCPRPVRGRPSWGRGAVVRRPDRTGSAQRQRPVGDG